MTLLFFQRIVMNTTTKYIDVDDVKECPANVGFSIGDSVLVTKKYLQTFGDALQNKLLTVKDKTLRAQNALPTYSFTETDEQIFHAWLCVRGKLH